MADPLVRSEMNRRMRERNAFWVPALYLTTMLLLAGAVYDVENQPWRNGNALFQALSGLSFLLVSLAVPVFAAGSITIEREQRTLASLFMTRLTPTRIVRSKLAAAALYVLLMVSTSLPLLLLAHLLGGPSLPALVLHYLSLITTTVLLASLGVLISASFKRSVYAIAFTYGVLVLLLMITVFVYSFLQRLQCQLDIHLLKYTAFVSPLYFLEPSSHFLWLANICFYGALAWLLQWVAVLQLQREGNLTAER